ncbi:MAG: Ig-like domain-containing protein [Acidobacteriota bacterium]|nr:Ig-like domain-containing protein [Acidobacteriota bacterium]
MRKQVRKHCLFRLFLAVCCLLWWTGLVQAQTPGCDVVWRKADNPRVINGVVTIPANQNVCAEPGVIVQFASDGKLNLLGRLTATGTSNERIRFSGSNVFPNRIEVVGTLDLRFADVAVPLNMNANGTLLCVDCRFNGRGMVLTLSGVTSQLAAGTRFVSLENVTFDTTDPLLNSDFSVTGVTAVLRNVTFRNHARCNVRNSYLYVDNVTSQNAAAEGLIFSQENVQPQFLNNLSITNSAGAGLRLDGGNFEIGQNVIIQNAEYPVRGGGGLLPGSQLPLTGNRNNWIEAGEPASNSIYAPVGLPYVVDGNSIIGTLQLLPGVVLKARQNFGFSMVSGPFRGLGLPDAPITIEPFNPSQKWLSGKFDSFGSRMEYVVLDGSQFGIAGEGGANTTYHIDNSILRNHTRAITSPQYQFAFLHGNLFANNETAIRTISTGVRASGKTNPNLFENNAVAVTGTTSGDFRYNWWNSPTGPTAPNNPGGIGDAITNTVHIHPFRTARPDRTDHPPVVRMPRVPYHYALGYYQGSLEPGSRAILTWKAADNRQIVKQKILFSPSGNSEGAFSVIADNLPASQRNFEFRVPSAGFQGTGAPSFVRVVAVDDKGQEGWDEWQFLIPSGEVVGNLQITSPVAGQTFRGGQEVPFNWTITTPFQGTSFNAFLILEGDRKIISLGGGTNTGTALVPKMPLVSTDSARFAVAAYGTGNRQKWFFSEPFAIRPDARFVDAAPQIALTSPAPNQEIPAGGVVPVAWTAADNEALRRFDVQASTDGGRTWINIAENLLPTATSFDWQLPPGGSSINDVRVRVIAFDRRFQNSSDGASRVFRIVAPQNAPPSVQITFPGNNATFQVGKSVFVAADAADGDGTIQRVEFYAAQNFVGQPSRTLLGSDTTAPYQIGWNLLFSGDYVITAEAIDNRGGVAVSTPINVTVGQSGGPLPIDPPELTSPHQEQVFAPGSDITLSAFAGVANNGVVVEFYNGTQLIGSDASEPYGIVWNDVPAGRYTLSAKAISGSGAEAVSKQVDIIVGSSPQATGRAAYDFDGDGKSDISVFRPADGVWYLNRSSQGFTAVQFGISTDKLAPADYDGDGKTDFGVFRDGNWYLLRSTAGFGGVQFGQSGDIPQPADFDGDGKTELAVFRPSAGTWFTLNLVNNQFNAVQFGASGDKPVVADYDADGKADYAVYRPADGTWYLLRSQAGFTGVQFGISTDKPVVGDYDGDGRADPAVYRNGTWYLLRSSQGFTGIQFGISTDLPAPADYDGDGRTDPAVYRDNTWYLLQSTQGFAGMQFGASGDQPVSNTFVP